jgi:hypothetical protein
MCKNMRRIERVTYFVGVREGSKVVYVVTDIVRRRGREAFLGI